MPANWLNDLLLAANGRAYTVAEADRLAEYAESLPDRLSAAKRLEESHKWLGKQLADAIAGRAADWGLPREALVADFLQSLAAVAHAMVMDDRPLLDVSVVAPFRGLADALDVPAEEIGELFHAAWAALARRLEPRPAALLEPYFVWAANSLCGGEAAAVADTPPPAAAATPSPFADPTPVPVEVASW